jgi:hypothetical protein
MSGIFQLIMLLLPLLLTGAVLSSVVTSLLPKVFDKLKQYAKEQKVLGLHKNHVKNPDHFATMQPELGAFFSASGWKECGCSNCAILKKKAVVNK